MNIFTCILEVMVLFKHLFPNMEEIGIYLNQNKPACVAGRTSNIKFVEHDQQVVKRSDGEKSLQLQPYSQNKLW